MSSDAFGPFVNALSTAIAAGVAMGIGYAIKRVQEQKAKLGHQPNLERDSRIHRDIDAVLNRCRDKIGATRVHLNDFKNGSNFADNSEAWYYSRTHEVVRHGVSYESDKHQNVLTSTVPEEMRLVLEAGPSLRRVKGLPQGRFWYLCDIGGVKWVARTKVQKLGNTVAFIGADFDTEQEPPDHCRAIVEAAFEVGQILATAR